MSILNEIDWTAVGVLMTAGVAVWQLRENSKQKAVDRKLETKRGVLLEGVRGMSQVMHAFGNIHNLNVHVADLTKLFQEGMGKITVASSVASLPAAKAGKEFTDGVGPHFLHAMQLRMNLEQLQRDSSFPKHHIQLASYILDNTVDLAKRMIRAIAAVRDDIGIAEEGHEHFLEAVYPDEALVKGAINKVLGR